MQKLLAVVGALAAMMVAQGAEAALTFTIAGSFDHPVFPPQAGDPVEPLPINVSATFTLDGGFQYIGSTSRQYTGYVSSFIVNGNSVDVTGGNSLLLVYPDVGLGSLVSPGFIDFNVNVVGGTLVALYHIDAGTFPDISSQSFYDGLGPVIPGGYGDTVNGYDGMHGLTVRVSGTTPDVDLLPSPAPEAPTWAMMIGGFGIMGLAMRRRQRASIRFA